MKVTHLLNQPFPFPEKRWKSIVLISAFISFFLLIFQPFQLSEIKGALKPLIIMGYGGVTFIALVLNLLLIPSKLSQIFREQGWTVKKQILYFLCIVFTIGLGNYFYTLAVTDFFTFNFQGFLLFQLYTLSVGLFPITFIVVIKQNKLYKRNLAAASELNTSLSYLSNASSSKNEKVSLWADNDRDKLLLEVGKLLYIEAMGNYVMVHYYKDTTYQKELLRCSLKKAQQALADFRQIIQCHRTYLVNLLQVEDAEGNAQGYNLKLKGISPKVPVSRKFIPQIKAHLEQLSD